MAEKTVELVNDGFWVKLTCDGQCNLSKPKNPELAVQLQRQGVEVPGDENNKSPWCVLECDRAKLEPEDPTKGEMCVMVSLRTPDGNRHGFYGKIGCKYSPGDGYEYFVGRRKAKP